MQIHDLNEKTLTNPAYVAFDDGTDTYKTEFNDVVADAAAAAVADADLTDNTVAFTSGDAASPTTWTAVSVLTSGLTIKELFNRISTMIKNVRYIWNLLGSSSFSNVASTLTGAIGNTALPTTAQTLSGAIAEHESDISTLNSKLTIKSYTVTPATNSSVSPFSTYAEMMIPSTDLSAYGSPVAVMAAGGGSGNPSMTKMNGAKNGFWVYAKNTTPLGVYVLFMK